MKKVVELIVNDKILDQIINNIAKNAKDEDLNDLKQDIYLELLEKNEEWLFGIYERGQMNYYLTRIVLNNINSKTSPFYYRYRKYKRQEVQIDDTAEKGEEPDYI